NCYDPTTHQCTNEKICLLSENICGRYCYNSSTHTCHENLILCKIETQEYCAKSCWTKNRGDNRTCSTNGKAMCYPNELSCSNECYDPNIETCFEDLRVCRTPR